MISLNTFNVGLLSREQLEEKYHCYRSIVEHAKEVIFQTDLCGIWTYLNPAWEEITGYRVEESLGSLFLNYIHPEDSEHVFEAFMPLGDRNISECRHELRYLTRHGGYRWVEVYARLMVDEANDITGISGTMADITERKQLEATLLQAKEAAEQSSRSKTEFLSHMCHELRTPLNTILGYAQLLEISGLTAAQKDDLKEIQLAGQHMLDSVNELLHLTRSQSDATL